MTSVLFGMTGPNPLRQDAQLHPVQREPGHARYGTRGKRCSVIAANSSGQTILSKGSLADGHDRSGIRLVHRLAAQQITAVSISHGEGVDTGSVCCAEPALEVHAPH